MKEVLPCGPGNGGKEIYFKPLLENSSLHVSALFIYSKSLEGAGSRLLPSQAWKNLLTTRSKAVDVVWGGEAHKTH